ncbi:hypothetical protein V8E54_008968 [Elaphomyces granulatus]
MLMRNLDPQHGLRGPSISIAATLQGPPWTTIPDLRIIGDIPIEIEFYNEASDEFLKGSVAICFGCICFRDRTPGIPGLFVKASKLNPCPGEPLLDAYINPLPAMMNAFLDFVGVVSRQL